MMSAQQAAQMALKARMSLEAHISLVAGNAIHAAAERGEQSCSFKIESMPHAELTAKRIEGILSKEGYKASHTVNRDGSITVGVTWLPTLEQIAPLYSQLPKGK